MYVLPWNGPRTKMHWDITHDDTRAESYQLYRISCSNRSAKNNGMRHACWISSRAPCKRIAFVRSIPWHNMSACMTNHVRKCLVVVPSSLQGCRHTWGGRPGRRATVGFVPCRYESKKLELVCWEGTLQPLTYAEKRLWEDSRMECPQLYRFIVFHTTAHHENRHFC